MRVFLDGELRDIGEPLEREPTIQTVTKTRTKFIPWLAGILFKFGFEGLSWRFADWYIGYKYSDGEDDFRTKR